MNNLKTKLSLYTLIAASISSCGYASKTDLDQLRSELGEVRATAQQAQTTANDAKQTAEKALESSKLTEEIVNRSFKKSMRK